MQTETVSVVAPSPAEESAARPSSIQRPRRRLVLCLDGTWNKRDSGTNVYHISNLVVEGDAGDGWTQEIYYDEGVGTGILDSVTGGAFGSGLSDNVREAYDWLVERFDEDDEIYVFGFSRGAFTARSLVSFIGKCGLLRRGAPVSVEQLWEGYQVLGRYAPASSGGVPQMNWWERIFGMPKRPFHELWELKREDWEKKWDDQRRALGHKVPEPLHPANRTERLLVQWSRRIPITCVGVWDTVASMGFDALAIPGVRTQIAAFHDPRLSSTVVNGFHALAIDEHRANFVHIPWLRATDYGLSGGATPLGGKIEQRWFVGAHSNVGGGYEDDLLAQFTLHWMMTECAALKLAFYKIVDAPAIEAVIPPLDAEPPRPGLAGKPPPIRDSFAEFAGVVWQHLIRSKRQYRTIAPQPQLQHRKPVQSLNEVVDPSAFALMEQSAGRDHGRHRRYAPPNLWTHHQTGPAPRNVYLPDLKSGLLLAFWLAMIAVTGWSLDRWLDEVASTLPDGMPFAGLIKRLAAPSFLFAAVFPLIAVFADWRESTLNFAAALNPRDDDTERKSAWLDFYLYVRLFAIGAFAIGLLMLAVHAWPWLRLLPTTDGWWLLGMNALLLYFHAIMAWCAAPMTEAGMGSIFRLQMRGNPRSVLNCLEEWAGGRKAEDRPLLRPVVRTLWRDILGFIPTYTVLLFCGTWLAASLLDTHGDKHLAAHWPLRAALALAVLCAIADLVEDCMHLGFVKRFPEAPPAWKVGIAFTTTWLKLVLFFAGLLLTVVAALWLIGRELREVAHAGAIGIASVLFLLGQIYAGVRETLFATKDSRRRREPGAV